MHGDGLLSTLYYTFRINNNMDPNMYLFSYQIRAKAISLENFVLVGDRYITADPKFLLTGKINAPQK